MTGKVIISTILVVLAWVLWERAMLGRPLRGDFEPISGYSTKKECEDAVTGKIAQWNPSIEEPRKIRIFPDGIMLSEIDKVTGTDKVIVLIDWRCLPETIDPRTQ